MTTTDVEQFRAALAPGYQGVIGVADEWGYRTHVHFAHLGPAVQEAAEHSSLTYGDEYTGRLEALELHVGDRHWEVWGGHHDEDEFVHIQFEDDSTLEVPAGRMPQSPNPALDTGPPLLEPVTQTELAGIELVLAEVWRAIDNSSLTETQQYQIIAMAELLQREQQAAEPGRTERGGLVAVLRAVLRFILREHPDIVLAWGKIVELLDRIGWAAIAATLPH